MAFPKALTIPRICRGVGSGACRVLFDVYHQHSTQHNVFADVTCHGDQIGYFQLGDSPGRKEPGSGGFDYRRFFRLTDARGYDGVFGMEHGNARPGRVGERDRWSAALLRRGFSRGAVAKAVRAKGTGAQPRDERPGAWGDEDEDSEFGTDS